MFKCTEKSTGKKFAAKFVITSRQEDRVDVERELDIMKSLQHPRLLQLYDAFDDGKKEMCLILELWVFQLIFLLTFFKIKALIAFKKQLLTMSWKDENNWLDHDVWIKKINFFLIWFFHD